MNRILLLVEGPTEERFVKDVLSPYFINYNIFLTSKIATTKKVKSGPDFKGGIVSYGKVKNEIVRLLQDSSSIIVTTMIDYYGFSNIVPFKGNIKGRNCYDKVSSLELLFKNDIKNKKFVPYLQLHEFEAILFSSPQKIVSTFGKPNKLGDILNIVSEFNSPEEINDDPLKIPSKRLINIFREYNKVLYGSLISKRIGIDEISNKCKHFNEWKNKLIEICK